MQLGFERPTLGQGIVAGLLALGAFAVPVLSERAIDSWGVRATASLLLAVYRTALSYLRKSPAGRIINLGLLRSYFAVDGASAAARAEQDLAELTRAMAAETGEYGITANYIQPGGVMTPDSRDTFRRNEGLRDYCIKRSASRRIGEPVDIAKVALFLASDDAAFVSGTGIAVDGGRLDD